MSMKSKLLFAAVALLTLVLVGLNQFRTVPPATPEPLAANSNAALSSHARLPARHLPLVADSDLSAAEDPSATNLFFRIFGTNDIPRLKPEQLEAWLKAGHRSAASLLAASRVTGDRSFLREAMEKYPNDPRVALDAYFFSESYDRSKAASPDRRKWLDVLKQSDPDNALGNYLAARDDFNAGRPDLALQELQAASGKSNFRDYSLNYLQDAEEAYRAAGYSEVAAKWAAGANLLLPTLYDLKQTGQSLVDLANQYRQAGDIESAQAALQMGLTLPPRFNGPDQFPLINTLVGIAIEKNLLTAMDPGAPFGGTGLTVQNELDALTQQRNDLRDLATQSEALLPMLSDQDLINDRERMYMFGGPAAMRWVIEKYGQH